MRCGLPIWPDAARSSARLLRVGSAGGDAYILSRVIHDWDDDAALKILGNCRRAIRADGSPLLIEGVSKPPNEPDPSKFLDVWFIGGGRMRADRSRIPGLASDLLPN